MKAIMGILLVLSATTSFAHKQVASGEFSSAGVQVQTVLTAPLRALKSAGSCISSPTREVIDFAPSIQWVPLQRFNIQTDYVLTRDDIEHLPYTNINDIISLFPGVYQAQRGGDISVYGSRLR